MIGVIANPAEHEVVREFFELFKTPWEFWRSDRHYDVLLCSGEDQPESDAKLVVAYAGKTTLDGDQHTKQRTSRCVLSYRERQLPIYGDTTAFGGDHHVLLREENSGQCAAYLTQAGSNQQARIGYDLFSEIRHLLGTGQPASNAAIPALELHIDFLRSLIIQCGIPVAEIPPVPEGAEFIACLTHDVDHPSIRSHRWDHTAFGFLHRAVFGSLAGLVRGQLSIRDAITNWLAALKLPFVYMGLASDFWADFAARYREIESGAPSTFFFIPYKNRPGKTATGSAPAFRAAGYEARDLQPTVQKLITAGCEVGLHGIDAWLDSSAGHEELEQIRQLTGNSETGVRMHWLFFNADAPKAIEEAGAAYDSTMGYNETIGFRAGTTQAYRPLGVDHLLELPVQVMDTALFYPTHLGLSPKEARARLKALVEKAEEFGGCFTVNWHDRSLAPERQWGECYRELIQELRKRGAWFATASQATAWFRKRRSATFEMEAANGPGPSVKFSRSHEDGLPGLRLRVHRPQLRSHADWCDSENYAEIVIEERIEAGVALEARQ